MKIEIEDDFASDITVASLLQGINDMDKMLEQYKDPDHGFIAMFHRDKKKDIAKIREVRNAMAVVAEDWYAAKVAPDCSGGIDELQDAMNRDRE